MLEHNIIEDSTNNGKNEQCDSNQQSSTSTALPSPVIATNAFQGFESQVSQDFEPLSAAITDNAPASERKQCIRTKKPDISKPDENDRFYSNKTGVHFSKYDKSWVARINSGGKIKKRYFSEKVYGFEEAKRRAIFCRLNMEKEITTGKSVMDTQPFRADAYSASFNTNCSSIPPALPPNSFLMENSDILCNPQKDILDRYFHLGNGSRNELMMARTAAPASIFGGEESASESVSELQTRLVETLKALSAQPTAEQQDRMAIEALVGYAQKNNIDPKVLAMLNPKIKEDMERYQIMQSDTADSRCSSTSARTAVNTPMLEMQKGWEMENKKEHTQPINLRAFANAAASSLAKVEFMNDIPFTPEHSFKDGAAQIDKAQNLEAQNSSLRTIS